METGQWVSKLRIDLEEVLWWVSLLSTVQVISILLSIINARDEYGQIVRKPFLFVTSRCAIAARAEQPPRRRWPPNFAPEVRVSGPTELYWFPDFYALASWSGDALSEKMGGLTRSLW